MAPAPGTRCPGAGGRRAVSEPGHQGEATRLVSGPPENSVRHRSGTARPHLPAWQQCCFLLFPRLRPGSCLDPCAPHPEGAGGGAGPQCPGWAPFPAQQPAWQEFGNVLKSLGRWVYLSCQEGNSGRC